jgi:intracellular sulfur oxidation DsrE/DsrF family protein
MTRSKSILSLAAVLLAAGIAAVSQTPAGPKHHVVFQLSEAEGSPWSSLIIHVNNVRQALAKDGGSQMEVVFYGPGIDMMRKTDKAHEEALKKLAESGIALIVCQNAMKMRNVKTEELFSFGQETESGIAEIAKKEESGWAYIH